MSTPPPPPACGEVRLIHGRGRGVQRGIVQAALERHPRVAEFWDDTSAPSRCHHRPLSNGWSAALLMPVATAEAVPCSAITA